MIGPICRQAIVCRGCICALLVFFCAHALGQVPEAAPLPLWTILIFMNGDNNLEPDALMNFRQLASVDSSPDVNVIVQFDRFGFGKYATTTPDWSQTLRFQVKKGTQPLPSFAVQDIGEADMGDPQVLADFVKWGKASYPSQHYMLVIWDHGQGWRFFTAALQQKAQAMVASRALHVGDTAQTQLAFSASLRTGYAKADAKGHTAPLTSAPGDGYRSASNDETDQDVLYDREIEDGLKSALGGIHLDVIGFDACLMGMLETGYALRDVADNLVGSEELEPGPGWKYDDLLKHIETAKPVDGRALAAIVVSSYQNAYEITEPDTTLSAISLTNIKGVATSVSSLADQMSLRLPQNISAVTAARKATSTYAPGKQFYHVDIVEFLDQLIAHNPDQGIKSAAVAASRSVKDSVFANYAGSDRQGTYGSAGLAIYFPATNTDHVNDPYAEGGYEKDNTYYPVEFVQDFHWADFLHSYWSSVP